MGRFTLLLTAFALYAQDPSKGVNFYSLEKERALGEQLAREFRRGATPLDSPDTLTWINDLAKRLAGSESQFTYTFELIKDDQTVLHEPISFPGGFVFVPAALILEAQSEDEFAGMLAHAMAHIAARHGTKMATKGQITNQATIPLIFMGGWQGFAISRSGALAVPRSFSKSHRAFELDADSLAAEMMSAAGYNPEALARYIERVQPPDPPQADEYSPMPERSARAAAIRALAKGRTYSPHPDFSVLQDEVRRRLSR
jgi:beta-barrel assembly-enhancing protease